MVEITHIKKIGKGILTEFPFVKGILEEYDSEKIQELNKQFHEDKIQKLKSLIEAINKLNPNKGREVTIERILHSPKTYYCNVKESDGCVFHYEEYFDADKLKVETKGEDNSKSYIAFLANLIFHNDDRNTTIYYISLTAFHACSVKKPIAPSTSPF